MDLYPLLIQAGVRNNMAGLPSHPPSAHLWEQLSVACGARLLQAGPAPWNWLGRVLSSDKLFQIRLLFPPGDLRGESYS